MYRAGENGPYIGVIESKTTQDGQDGTTITETQYYQLTGPDGSKRYTATGEAYFLPYILRSTERPRWKALQQPTPKAS